MPESENSAQSGSGFHYQIRNTSDNGQVSRTSTRKLSCSLIPVKNITEFSCLKFFIVENHFMFPDYGHIVNIDDSISLCKTKTLVIVDQIINS